MSNCDTEPSNTIEIDHLTFPTSSRRQSAPPVSPSQACGTSFSFDRGEPPAPARSHGNSPKLFHRTYPPPVSTTPDIFFRRDRDKVYSSSSPQKSDRRAQTAAGDIRREMVETKTSSTTDERKAYSLPRGSRRISPPGVTISPPNELNYELPFERRRRAYTDGRFPPALRRHDTYHGDFRRQGKYQKKTGPRPTSMIETAQTHDDYKVLQQYQPNRAGSASIANRVIKTNPLFPDLGPPVDLPAIALPVVPISARSRKHPNKPFYETPVSDRHSTLPTRSSRSVGDQCPTYLTDNVQRLSRDVPTDTVVNEISRLLRSLRVEEIEQKGTSVTGRWNGVIFSTIVVSSTNTGHSISFSRLSGDNYKYKEICDRVLAAINV